MTEFRDFGKLRTWLAGQTSDLVTVFALRAGLRVLPTLPGQGNLDRILKQQQIEDVILLSFRALSVSWASAVLPSHRNLLQSSANAASISLRSNVAAKFAASEAAASIALANSDDSVDRVRFEAMNAIGKAGAAFAAISVHSSYLFAAYGFDADKSDKSPSRGSTVPRPKIAGGAPRPKGQGGD